MWRCLNDNFSYCSGTPECEVQPDVVKVGIGSDYVFMGGVCKLDPKTCGKYQTFSDTMVSIELTKGSYRHTVTAKKKAKKGGK